MTCKLGKVRLGYEGTRLKQHKDSTKPLSFKIEIQGFKCRMTYVHEDFSDMKEIVLTKGTGPSSTAELQVKLEIH